MTVGDKERIAVIEARQNGLESLMTEVRNDVKAMREDFNKARGLVAGAVLAVSAIWGVAIGVWQFIKHKVA